MSEFVDFHLIIKPLEGRSEGPFYVAIADAPVQRLHCGFWQLGKSGATLSDLLKDLGYLRNPGTSGSASLPPPAGIAVSLFDSLFPAASRAREILRNSCDRLCDGQILRLKLELHSSLANIPWEALQPSQELLEDVSILAAPKAIVRYVGDIDAENLPVGNGVVIIIRAHPVNIEPVIVASLDREISAIREQAAKLGGAYEFIYIHGPNTRSKLQEQLDLLRRNKRRLVGLHYLGHANVDKDMGPHLCWEDGNSELDRVSASSLNDILEETKSMNWVVLNACCSAFTPAELPLAGMATFLSHAKRIPAVVGYNRPVESDKAEILGGKFFAQVLNVQQPRSVEEVVARMQKDIANPGGLIVLWRSLRRSAFASPSDFEAAEQKRSTALSEVDRQTRASAAVVATEKNDKQYPPSTDEVLRNQKRAPPGMVFVPDGPFKKGLTRTQMETLLSRFKEMGLDPLQGREVLSLEEEGEASTKGFFIDRTPVTNADFEKFARAAKYTTYAEKIPGQQNWTNFRDRRNHPVVYVTLEDARAYCKFVGKRLPSEDEWKKSARGPNGLIYPWGDEFAASRCNTAESMAGFQTTPVDKFAAYPSPHDCLDMVGNVEEWTDSEDGDGHYKILGGSWAMTCEVYGILVLHRLALADYFANDLGFRCVMDIA